MVEIISEILLALINQLPWISAMYITYRATKCFSKKTKITIPEITIESERD